MVGRSQCGLFSLVLAITCILLGGCGSQSQPPPPPPKMLTSIRVTPANPSVASGSAQQFAAIGTFNDGSTADITSSASWSSSDTTLATINSSGLVTAVAIGRPRITAALGSASGSATLIVVAGGTSAVPRFAYAADIVDNTISMYTVNATTGQLRHNGYALAGGSPTSVALDPASRFAYVSNNSSNTISAYSVDPARGTLTEIAGSPFSTGAGSSPNAVAVDPSGTFVYTANQSGNVSAFSITSTTGALVPITGSPVPAGTQPVSVTAHPSGRFLYVTNASSSNVSAYSIDPASGALTAVSGSPFASGSLPYSLEVDPSGKFAYVANSQSNSVSAFAIDSGTGALTPVAGSPFAAGSGPNSLTVDPSSKFLYVTNNTGNNVSAYTIGSSGALTSVTGSPFAAGSVPNSVKVDPSGKFTYVANLGTLSESISEYAIDPTSGALTSLGEVRTRGQAVSMTMSSSTKPVTYTPKFAYVANVVSNNVSAFIIERDGVLSPVSGSPFPSDTYPFGVTTDPDGKFAFVTNGARGKITAYLVDQKSGSLTTVTGSPFAVQAASQLGTPAVDPSGRFLYVPNYSSFQVFAYSIDPVSGSLTQIPGSPFAAAREPVSAAVDPTGRFLYVACQNGPFYGGLSAYSIDMSSGSLTEIAGSPYTAGPEPSSVVVDPSGRFVYVSNQTTDTTFEFLIDGATGALTQIGATTPIAGAAVSITVEPSGRFAYASDGLAYTIDTTTGALTQIPGSSFAPGPIAFSITADPSGNFIYIADQGGGVSAYSINLTTGSLTPLIGSPFAGGTAPISVAITAEIQ